MDFMGARRSSHDVLIIMVPPASSILLTLVAGYLLGAISFAVIIARRYGVDILKEGSGNPGATNVKRVLGKRPGNLCFALDALKGFVAAGWPLVVYRHEEWAVTLGVIGIIAAIAGHSYSVFIGFKGGKGVATTVGGLLAVSPYVILIGAFVWVLIFYTTRYVSLASICLGVSLPLSAWLLDQPLVVLLLTILLALILIVRHRTNIIRLLNGTENRFQRKSQSSSL